MYNLICTTYNKTEQGLVLANNWIEKNRNKDYVEQSLLQYEITPDILDLKILEGKFGNKVIHVLIVVK